MAYTDKKSEQLKVDEKNFVEDPFLDQLEGLGWQVLRLDKEQRPDDSFRESFTDVVMLAVLRESLLRINDWMTDAQVDEVVRRITEHQSQSLLENNR